MRSGGDAGVGMWPLSHGSPATAPASPGKQIYASTSSGTKSPFDGEEGDENRLGRGRKRESPLRRSRHGGGRKDFNFTSSMLMMMLMAALPSAKPGGTRASKRGCCRGRGRKQFLHRDAIESAAADGSGMIRSEKGERGCAHDERAVMSLAIVGAGEQQ